MGRYFTGDSKIPVLIVGNKSDKGTPIRQDFSLQPEAFCARYKIPSPQLYSTTRSQFKRDIFVKLATMAAFSNLRRLVHAMILKQPPREWIGTFRFVHVILCIYLLFCLPTIFPYNIVSFSTILLSLHILI